MRSIAMRYGLQGEQQQPSGTSWRKLGTTTITTSSTSTTATAVGTITLPEAWTKAKIICVRVRDSAGKRNGYFYGHDTYFTNFQIANGSTSTLTAAAHITYADTSAGVWYEYGGQYGVYGYSISSAGVVTIRRRYHSTYSLTINGTYNVEVWVLDFPDGKSVFD